MRVSGKMISARDQGAMHAPGGVGWCVPCTVAVLAVVVMLAVFSSVLPEPEEVHPRSLVHGRCAGTASALQLGADLAKGEERAPGIMPAAATSPQHSDIDDWREEGIRKAAELTGLPEAFFRWLQDKGLPVGEFMRFLTPFLQWLELTEEKNGTQASPPGKTAAPTTI